MFWRECFFLKTHLVWSWQLKATRKSIFVKDTQHTRPYVFNILPNPYTNSKLAVVPSIFTEEGAQAERGSGIWHCLYKIQILCLEWYSNFSGFYSMLFVKYCIKVWKLMSPLNKLNVLCQIQVTFHTPRTHFHSRLILKYESVTILSGHFFKLRTVSFAHLKTGEKPRSSWNKRVSGYLSRHWKRKASSATLLTFMMGRAGQWKNSYFLLFQVLKYLMFDLSTALWSDTPLRFN